MDSIARIADSMLSARPYSTIRLDMGFWGAFAFVASDTPVECTETLFAGLVLA